MSLILDLEGTQCGDKLKTTANVMDLPLKFLKRKTQWANLAELYIGLLIEAVRFDMHRSESYMIFWDYCKERRALINISTAKNLFQLQGSNTNAAILGESGDFLICVNMNDLNGVNIYILLWNSAPRNEKNMSFIWSG